MVKKAFLFEPQRKAVTFVRHPSIMVVIGLGAFLLFIGETVGTAQELPTGTISLSARTFIERSGLGGISDSATATHNAQATASPGQWLIDDIAKERAKFELSEARSHSRQPTLGTPLMSERGWLALVGRTSCSRGDELDWHTNGRR